MEGDAERVGSRVAKLRKLAGWTQHQLAARAFVSTSLVKQVEQGKTPPSPAFVASCAQALGVDARDLYGISAEESITELHSQVAGIVELREALHAFDDPQPTGDLLSVSALRQSLNKLERRRRSQKFSELAMALPATMHHLFAHVERTAPETDAGEDARSMLHDTYRLVANVGHHFRQADIAATASERHIFLAPSTGDPLRVALSDWHRSTHFMQNGLYAAGNRLLDRAIAKISERPPSPKSNGMSVQLHLRAAVMAARGGDGERADDHVREARRLVRNGCESTPYYNTDASELNVAIHWCAIPVEMYDGSESVNRASKVAIVDRTRPERVAHHHIDQARAWLLHENRERALTELNHARRISPQQTRMHPSVHETVRAIAEADRRATDTLAGFARWAGIRI